MPSTEMRNTGKDVKLKQVFWKRYVLEVLSQKFLWDSQESEAQKKDVG